MRGRYNFWHNAAVYGNELSLMLCAKHYAKLLQQYLIYSSLEVRRTARLRRHPKPASYHDVFLPASGPSSNILYIGYGGYRHKNGTFEIADGYSEHNIIPALARVGKITCLMMPSMLPWESREWHEARECFNAAILEAAEVCQPTIVIGQMWGWYVNASTIRRITAARIPVVNYSWDDTASFYGKKLSTGWSGTAELGQVVTVTLTSSSASCLNYRAEGGRAEFWPEAAHPPIMAQEAVHCSPQYDVSFVGSCYGYRPVLLRYLRSRGTAVAAFGHGWNTTLPSVQQVADIIAHTRVNLGFSGIGHMPNVTCLKGRDFEVPACGGLYMTSISPDLSKCFRLEDEVVTYRNPRECIEKIRWLLASPQQAARIREAGYRRALKEHTWDHRVQQLFEIVRRQHSGLNEVESERSSQRQIAAV